MNVPVEVVIKGQPVALKFAIPAVRFWIKKIQSQSILVEETSTLMNVSAAIYGGHLNYCLVRDMVPKVTFEDVMDWVEEAKDVEGMQKAMDAFNDSVYIKQVIETVDEEKKRLTGTKSKKPRTGNSA
jgi:hypothetical protein